MDDEMSKLKIMLNFLYFEFFQPYVFYIKWFVLLFFHFLFASLFNTMRKHRWLEFHNQKVFKRVVKILFPCCTDKIS